MTGRSAGAARAALPYGHRCGRRRAVHLAVGPPTPSTGRECVVRGCWRRRTVGIDGQPWVVDRRSDSGSRRHTARCGTVLRRQVWCGSGERDGENRQLNEGLRQRELPQVSVWVSHANSNSGAPQVGAVGHMDLLYYDAVYCRYCVKNHTLNIVAVNQFIFTLRPIQRNLPMLHASTYPPSVFSVSVFSITPRAWHLRYIGV